MMRLLPMFLGFLLVLGQGAGAWAASQQAAALRQANSLVATTPSQRFLEANFVADEMNPGVIFGAVKSFVASRKCPTTWLMETGSKSPLTALGGKGMPPETTLYLEEDCPGKVVYYVFVDQSRLSPQQWIEWRQKFHKSKTEPEFGSIKSKLDKACQAGCGVGAELRFIQVNGDLMAKSPEAVLRHDLKFAPIYDLNRGRKLSP
jgi:hypothetical protein